MDRYITGAVIRELREKHHMTQAELAERLSVSDKTVSKWETGKGYPDISLLEPIARAFSVSVTELLSGNAITNLNVSANMLRTKFYVCPVCGNVLHATGEAVISCHGLQLLPAEAEKADESHPVTLEKVEDEYYITLDHEMTREHYISFIAGLSSDGLQFIKLYPEGACACRLKIRGLRRIYFYCNRDGLYYVQAPKAPLLRRGAVSEAD